MFHIRVCLLKHLTLSTALSMILNAGMNQQTTDVSHSRMFTETPHTLSSLVLTPNIGVNQQTTDVSHKYTEAPYTLNSLGAET